MKISIKRVYDQPVSSDGIRVLVDRLWPRGLAKAKAGIDVWGKAVAPSTGLRQWFAHDAKKWPEFQVRYVQELEANEAGLKQMKDCLSGHRTVTLLFAATDVKFNHAVVLRKFLMKSLRQASST